VDLEGAKAGALVNAVSLSAICGGVKAKIQFGGGLRHIQDKNYIHLIVL
jgi:phosphoribosylformimino-5-aminoimidazole carboxamide ribonucleotide (ProFAR) isomerase